MGVVLPQSGRGFKHFARALRATILLEPSSQNPGSATDFILCTVKMHGHDINVSYLRTFFSFSAEVPQIL